ncbi:MAG: hypothetical protein J6U54_12585 [Clostridiales bacterium]|nr:hypothetical protein [Clostridiales bacterium]
MTNSILTSVKKGVGGITELDEAFDDELIMHINSALAQLTQLGVGPVTGFQISDKTATWQDFVGEDPRLNMIQIYVTCVVRMIFDPPTIGAVAQAYRDRIAELEWRLNVQAETPANPETD